MAKKLVTIILALTIVACSSISIYATDTVNADDQNTDSTSAETTAIETTGGDEDKKEEAVPSNEESDSKATTTNKATTTKAKNTKYKKGLAAYIRYINPGVSNSKSLNMAGYFIKYGNQYNIDPAVLMAIAQCESTFKASAKSPYGYKGLMQTSDALARASGYKPSDLYKASVSIKVGAKYLRAMKNRFKTYTKALSAYAYGSGAVSTGNYSNAIANRLLKIRKQINSYLDRKNYV